MLVFMFELNSRLNHKMFLLRFLLSAGCGVNMIFSLKPLFLSALFYSRPALSKHSLSHELLDIFLLILAEICLVIDDWWFHCLWIYKNSLLTFLYGKYFPVRKLKVTSKKSVIRKLHSTVIFHPCCLKILQSCFVIFADSGPESFWKELNLSYLYKPILLLPNSSLRIFSR